eukprot:3051668-Alexandrium_andersonii.AAC.1
MGGPAHQVLQARAKWGAGPRLARGPASERPRVADHGQCPRWWVRRCPLPLRGSPRPRGRPPRQ